MRKFLVRNQISEVKQVGALTERQRNLLAAQLECAAVLAEIEARMAEREAAQEAEHAVVPAEIEVAPETAEDYVLVGVA